MAVASAVAAGLLVVDADVVIPVGVHEALVAVAEGGPFEDGLAGTGGLIDTGASLQGGRAVVLIVAVAVVPAVVVPVALGVGFHFGLAKHGWDFIDLLKADGSGSH